MEACSLQEISSNRQERQKLGQVQYVHWFEPIKNLADPIHYPGDVLCRRNCTLWSRLLFRLRSWPLKSSFYLHLNIYKVQEPWMETRCIWTFPAFYSFIYKCKSKHKCSTNTLTPSVQEYKLVCCIRGIKERADRMGRVIYCALVSAASDCKGNSADVFLIKVVSCCRCSKIHSIIL